VDGGNVGGCGAARGAASVTAPEYQSADHAEYESRDLLDLSVDYLEKQVTPQTHVYTRVILR
jgi:hypothetical protein